MTREAPHAPMQVGSPWCVSAGMVIHHRGDRPGQAHVVLLRRPNLQPHARLVALPTID
jgi:hypothetical protein